MRRNVSKKRSHLFSAQARGNKAGRGISSHNGLQLQSLKMKGHQMWHTTETSVSSVCAGLQYWKKYKSCIQNSTEVKVQKHYQQNVKEALILHKNALCEWHILYYTTMCKQHFSVVVGRGGPRFKYFIYSYCWYFSPVVPKLRFRFLGLEELFKLNHLKSLERQSLSGETAYYLQNLKEGPQLEITV